MKEQLISFETAKLAKEKGITFLYSDYAYTREGDKKRVSSLLSDVSVSEQTWFRAPTQALLQKCLRENKGLYIKIRSYPMINGYTGQTRYKHDYKVKN